MMACFQAILLGTYVHDSKEFPVVLPTVYLGTSCSCKCKHLLVSCPCNYSSLELPGNLAGDVRENVEVRPHLCPHYTSHYSIPPWLDS